MDKAKILSLCNEIEDAVNELAACCEIIDLHTHAMLIDKLRGITAEITAPPKSNGDRIRQMTDEELAAFIDIYNIEDICRTRCAVVNYHDCMAGEKCKGNILLWLKQEASEDEAD